MNDLKDDPEYQHIGARLAQQTNRLVAFIRGRHPDAQAGASTGGCWRAPNKERKYGLVEPDCFMTKYFPRDDLKEGAIVVFGTPYGDRAQCYVGRVIEVLEDYEKIDEVRTNFRGETRRFTFTYTHIVEVIETIGYNDAGHIYTETPDKA